MNRFNNLKSSVRGSALQAILYGSIGLIVFFGIYGPLPLDVTYDHWILNGYDEYDIVQHYAGWLSYRNSPWTFPLGLMDELGGGAVTFTDSIPWVAILFKLLSPVLPQTFQYFGLYICLCYVLQGVAAGFLVSKITKNRFIVFGGVLLFCLSPILMERAFRHTALASQWLILFAFNAYLRSRQTGKMSSAYCFIGVLSIGIHPYFLPMVFSIMFANIIELSINNRCIQMRSVLIACGSLMATCACGYVIGALGTSTINSNGGFGYYSMNLNALINPTSIGVSDWSLVLDPLPQTLGNYDGFNYLGFGVIVGCVISILVLAVRPRKLLDFTKRNVCLLVLGVCLSLFAVSNVVTCNGSTIFTYPLPEILLKWAAVFRASSRLFYPVYYLMLLFCLYCIASLKKPLSIFLISFIALVQIVDLSPAIAEKHQSFDRNAVELSYSDSSYNGNAAWQSIAANADRIKLINSVWDYRLAAFGVINDLHPDITIVNRRTDAVQRVYDNLSSNMNELETGNIDERAVYISNDLAAVLQFLQANDGLKGYYLPNNYYGLAVDAMAVEAEVMTPNDDYIQALNKTGGDWAAGVKQLEDSAGSCVVFPYSDMNYNKLSESTFLSLENDDFRILNVKIEDDEIVVEVEGEASLLKFPERIRMVKP